MKVIKTSPYIPTEVDIQQDGPNRAIVQTYPFEAGYGITVAHPLRRLILGSSVGYAPIGVQIEGADHEFDTIRGMHEDIAVFMLNLKNIRFKLKDGSDSATLEYSFSGQREICGSDLENENVEVVNPEKFLASLNEDGQLNFTVMINKGMGYIPSEEFRDELPKDFIAMDAFFTPVKKANYKLENILVEDNPNFEKVIFEIETDGQIEPAHAVAEALEVMHKQMSVFSNVLDIDISKSKNDGSVDEKEIEFLTKPLSDLDLTVRSFNCLDKAEIKYIGELVMMNEAELKDVKNLGKKSLDEIKSRLEDVGYPVESKLDDSIAKSVEKKLSQIKE
ncbi:MAG: DNA-directed RNA polymerase subunit alpha [Campylobacterota bacterium]